MSKEIFRGQLDQWQNAGHMGDPHQKSLLTLSFDPDVSQLIFIKLLNSNRVGFTALEMIISLTILGNLH